MFQKLLTSFYRTSAWSLFSFITTICGMVGGVMLVLWRFDAMEKKRKGSVSQYIREL